MLIVGFNGSTRTRLDSTYTDLDRYAHNSAAVLLKDGQVVAAMEEERLDRLKHSHKAPLAAIRFCLEQGGISSADVDHFAFYFSEPKYQEALAEEFLLAASLRIAPPLGTCPRATLANLLQGACGHLVPESKIEFVQHHECHAFSAFAQSGFERCLVITLDGWGEAEAGLVGIADAAGGLKTLRTFRESVGLFYLRVIAFLGYYHFDEYKVMGMAPYGNRERFRAVFSGLYSLERDGGFKIRDVEQTLYSICRPRLKDEPIEQVHLDIAAALQEGLETIVLHVVEHYRGSTGERRLCLAGGVALNCTLNGKVLESGWFEDLFIQPAAHDAGCSLGAALATHFRYTTPQAPLPRCRHVYWGTPIGDKADVSAELEKWGVVIGAERCDSIAARAAALLAEGKVIGWVQGRSEFGPRALGNRCILADPRPAENRRRVNGMIKNREWYRPFAPSVAAERMHRFFEVPDEVAELPFMLVVCKVKEQFRAELGAITHVDGTARVQSVARDVNTRYWQLLSSFESLTGYPILLNTSFNNDCEPIVDSVRDAIVCYLTTGLDYLVVGDFLVQRTCTGNDLLERLTPRLPWYETLAEVLQYDPLRGVPVTRYRLATVHAGRFDRRKEVEVSANAWAVLRAGFLGEPLRTCLARAGLDAPQDRSAVLSELMSLWQQRRIELSPLDAGRG